MYPLKGDHNLPEVSKPGMIQTPQQVVNQHTVTQGQQSQGNPSLPFVEIQQQQPQVEPLQQIVNNQIDRTVASNFPKVINPAHTYNHIINPALPIAQPFFLRREGYHGQFEQFENSN